MKLIVGIGNPGSEYDGTRHNLGFRVVDLLAERHGLDCRKRQFQARTGGGRIAAEQVLLLKPETYVNESGRAVRAALDWHGLALADLLVVCDDFSLPLGRLRVRGGGGSGGHNGLRSLAAALGGEDWARLRIGIGAAETRCDRDYVLSRFRPEERAAVESAIAAAADAVELWLAQGLAACMDKTNRRETPPSSEEGESPVGPKEETH